MCANAHGVIGVTVTTDGDGFIYETNPFAFTFLVPRALDKMFEW